MDRPVKTRELFVCTTPYLCELFDLSTYPWDILPRIKDYIIRLTEKGIDGFWEISPGVWVGKNVKIYPMLPLLAWGKNKKIDFFSIINIAKKLIHNYTIRCYEF